LEGRYKVTSFGRVFSTKTKNGYDNTKEIKHRKRKSGICLVAINDGVKTKQVRVDKLVADAFVDNRDGYNFVRHIDGDWSNNNSDNLMFVKDNPNNDPHAFRDPGLSDQDLEDVKSRWLGGESQVDLANAYHVSVTAIRSAIDGLKRPFVVPEGEPGEQWRPVSGFEEQYYISSYGRILSTGCGRRAATMLKPARGSDGYLHVNLATKDHEQRHASIHRLVASAFCDGRTEERNVVNHKDGNPLNNRADNLEWCTAKENTRHAVDTLGVKMGGNEQTKRTSTRTIPKETSIRRSPLRKFSDDEVIAIRSDPRSSRKVAEEYGCNKCTILRVRSGESYRDI
ncbi:MAG: NUMOD4 motif-containing HNH endonuclease, partial [Eggerthellaceae bacterium]|nr:NUMOD4 motif-containing HNH endonuclease [Eggerthellaceae bacterium]